MCLHMDADSFPLSATVGTLSLRAGTSTYTYAAALLKYLLFLSPSLNQSIQDFLLQ